MADNLSEACMDLNLAYEGSHSNYANITVSKRKIPANAVNTYAPGSPKPMNEIEQCYDGNKTDRSNLHQHFSGLRLSPNFMDGEENFNEQNGHIGNKMDENLKDAKIKYLERNNTMLKAKVHHLDQLKDRLDAVLRDRVVAHEEFQKIREQNEGLLRSNEQLRSENKQRGEEVFKLQQILRQMSSDSHMDSDGKQVLYDKYEIEKLRMENDRLQKLVASQENTLRESLNANEHSHNSFGNNSSLSNQMCSKELENLHLVVDALKSTVLQQRNFLLKIKTPQSIDNMVSIPNVHRKSQGNIGQTVISSNLPRCRQGEEGSASPIHYNKERRLSAFGDANSLDRVNGKVSSVSCSSSSSTVDPREIITVPRGSGVTRMYPDSAKLPSSYVEANNLCPVPLGHENIFAESVESLERSISPQNGVNTNKMIGVDPNDRGQSPYAYSPILIPNGRDKSTSPKRDLPTATENEERPFLERLGRKTSHTEKIIRPLINLSERPNKSENLGYNPHLKANLQSESSPQKQPSMEQTMMVVPPSVSAQQQGLYQPRWQEPSQRPPAVLQTSAHSNRMTLQPSNQSSHLYVQQDWPAYSNSSVVGNTVRNPSSKPTLNVGHAMENPNPHAIASQLPASPRERLNSDRLCPVCNQDFGTLSIDEFQSHVLECFDSESGPETMIAEDSGPQRICPMCNTSFGDNMSQSEYEKHVHSHFGEEPGENFEVLRP